MRPLAGLRLANLAISTATIALSGFQVEAPPPMIPWMDAALAQPGLSELVLDALDAESLLAMRVVERRGPGLVDVVFNLDEAKHLLRCWHASGNRHLCCSRLAEQGELRLLQYARTGPHPFPWSVYTATGAVGKGHAHVLYWMYFEANPPVATPHALSDVFFGGVVVREHWGIESEAAAGAGRLDMIKWLRKHHFPLSQKVCSHAAHAGHLDVLKYTLALADPYVCWVAPWLAGVRTARENVAMDCRSTTSERFHTTYRERLEIHRWLSIFQWYFPFGNATERAQMLELVPREWLEEA